MTPPNQFAGPSFAQDTASRRTKIIIATAAVVGAVALLALIAGGVLFGSWAARNENFFVPSNGMAPTLVAGDHVQTSKLASDAEVQRSWVVVMQAPPDVPDKTIKTIIKRVVAVPGDMVQASDGHLVVNGTVVDEPYVAPGVVTDNVVAVTLGPNEYYVLGDNRGDSADSRTYGPVNRSAIERHVTKVRAGNGHGAASLP